MTTIELSQKTGRDVNDIKILHEESTNLGKGITKNLSHKMSNEFEESAKAFGWGTAEFKELTLCALNAAFIDDKSPYLKQIEERYDQFQR